MDSKSNSRGRCNVTDFVTGLIQRIDSYPSAPYQRFGRAYSQKLLGFDPRNLVAYWPCTEISGGVLQDISPNRCHGVISNALYKQDGIGDSRASLKMTGTAPTCKLYSAELKSNFNRSEGTLAVWWKPSGIGDWNDGAYRTVIMIGADSSNEVGLSKGNGAHQFLYLYFATGATKLVIYNTPDPTNWIQVAITWSRSADQVKAYYNATQVGATQTGLGNWTADITDDRSAIGSSRSAVSEAPGKGWVAHAIVFRRALSQPELAYLYEL